MFRDFLFTARRSVVGHYKLMANRDKPEGQYSSSGVELELEVPASVRRDIVLDEPGGSLTGTVTPPGVHANVTIENDSYANSATADSGGHYMFHGLPPGTYKVAVSSTAWHMLGDHERDEVTIAAERTVTHDLTVRVAAGEIRGRVVDATGSPIGDAVIGIGFENGDAAFGEALADEDARLVTTDGRFTASQLPPGTYTVSASRPGGSRIHVEHVEVGREVTLVLPAPGAIAVAVYGVRADDLHVRVIDRAVGQAVRDEWPRRTGETFELPGLAPGTYTVEVTAGDDHELASATVASGATARVELQLHPRVTLIGRAVDAHTHRPLPSVEVSASLIATGSFADTPSDARNQSDAAGRFEVPFVPRGELELSGHNYTLTRSMNLVALHRTITASDPDVIDLGDLLVVVTPADRSAGEAGVTLEVVDGVARVTGVEGAAAQAGVTVGDVVLAINGTSVRGAAAALADALLMGMPGESLDLELARGMVKVVLVTSAR